MITGYPTIVVVLPVRNEAEYLPALIESLAAQTLRPAECLFVNDGSTDATAQILDDAAAQHSWLRAVHKLNRGVRSVGPGVVEAFNYGLQRVRLRHYDFICKMDGDLRLPERYFEALVEEFRKDPYLGSASGKVFLEENGALREERTADEMVVGAANFYRRECFEDIGGFVPKVMWDGMAYHHARMAGWRTRSFRHPDLRIIHRRLMGSSHKSVLHGRIRWGRGQYILGTHPLYLLAIMAYRMLEKPFIIGGLAILGGYIGGFLAREERHGTPAFRKSLRAWQFERLRIGRRLERIPEPTLATPGGNV